MSKNFEEIKNKILGIQKQAADSTAINMKDPAEKGEVTPPSHPDGDSKAKTGVPDQQEQNKSREGQDLTDKDTNPSSTGKNVPATEDGNAKEKVDKPNDPLSKIASDLPDLMSRISKLRGDAKEAGVKPAEATSTKEAGDQTAPETDESKKAKHDDQTNQDIEFSPEFHMKLAQEILSSEEGVTLAERILEKSAGVEAAQELIKQAGEQQYQLAKEAAEQEQYEQYLAEQQAQQEYVLQELTKNASEEDVQAIIKKAQVHTAVSDKFEHDWQKQAYDVGAQDAAAMEDAMAGGEEVGDEAELDPETILALLDEAVQSGELDEETAMALAEELLGGADMMGGGEELPPEVAEAEKFASLVLAEDKD